MCPSVDIRECDESEIISIYKVDVELRFVRFFYCTNCAIFITYILLTVQQCNLPESRFCRTLNLILQFIAHFSFKIENKWGFWNKISQVTLS